MIYLDHNATTPIRPAAIARMSEVMGTVGNASAVHGVGRASARIVNRAREVIGGALGVCAQDVIFTASGTEGDNTAVHSAVAAGCRRLLVSSMDHPASYLAALRCGAEVEFIPADRQGRTDVDWLADRLHDWDASDGRPFVSVVAANSECGVIQDVERATNLVRAVNGLILVDAVQVLGKRPMTFQPDYLVVSAHKMGGPQGVGALYVADGAPFDPLLDGGGQERRRRAGTLNTAGIAGFAAAVEAMEDLSRLAPLRDRLEAGLRAMEPDLVITGEGAERLPNTSLFGLPGVSSQTLLMGLDLEGVCVSTGTACASLNNGVSRAVNAMSLADTLSKGLIRVSLGWTSTDADVDTFLSVWAKIRRHAPVRHIAKPAKVTT